MKSAPILLVAFGLLLLYVVLSDKYACFTSFVSCLTGQDNTSGTGSGLPSFQDNYNEGQKTAKDFCESIFGVGSWFCNTDILPGQQHGAGGSW